MKNNGLIYDIKKFSIHDGPGIRTTVFLKGCPLNCLWCHNPEGICPGTSFFYDEKKCLSCLSCVRHCPQDCIIINNRQIQIDLDQCTQCNTCVSVCPSNALTRNGVYYSSEELMNLIKKDSPFYDESSGGVTFSGGEPLLQFDFLVDMLNKCKEHGINTTVDTSGYATINQFERIRAFTDLFLYDLKLADEAEHMQYTGVSNHMIMENLKFLLSQNAKIWIRIPLIPGINDTQENIDATLSILKKSGFSGRIHLLAYHDLSTVKIEKMLEKLPQNIKKAITQKNKNHLELNTIKAIFESQG